MPKWFMDDDEDYFRIFDSKKDIAGYFDPDYGKIDDQNASEEIERMVRERVPIRGGHLMVPLAKFGIFDTDYESNLDVLEGKVNSVAERIKKWKQFVAEGQKNHYVRISHTDHDMLSITFPIEFANPVPVDKNLILPYLEPMLERLSSEGLL